METIRYLIGFFLKIAFALFLFVFVWWVVSLLFPGLSFRSLIGSISGNNSTATSTKGGGDWLPSPRKYSGLFAQKTNTTGTYGNVYVSAPPYSGYGLNLNQYQYTTYNYVTYTSKGLATTTLDGKEVISAPPKQTTTQPGITGSRSLTVRNLSIYEGGHVYTGLTFVGEARSTMFRDGKFPIVVVDQSGRMIGVSAAVATTDWAVPGWTRFQTKILYTLPQNVPCTMIFEEALTQAERNARTPLRVPIQVKCN
jgi:hypothetical protein